MFRAKRDPESSPAKGGIQAVLDSGFNWIDGPGDFLNKLAYNSHKYR
jgi:hypothetical protein